MTREEYRLLLAAFSASQGIGMMAYWALPVLIGAMALKYKLTATQAGVVGTIEFLGVLAGSLALSPFVSRIPRRTFVFVGAAIVIVANLASGLLSPGLPALRALRFIAGIGAGLALAVGNATIANAKRPESIANYMTIILVVYMVVAMPAYTRVSDAYGFTGICLALAATASVSMIFLIHTPNRAAFQNQESVRSSAFSWLSFAGSAALLVVLLFGFRDTLPWLFAEQLGANAKMASSQMGNLFALMYAVGLLGPVAALSLGRFLPQIGILALGVALSGAFGVLILSSGGNARILQFGILAWAVAYFATFAELAAFLAALDRGGRLASAMGSALMLGIMVTPAIGGVLFDAGSYWLVATTSLLATVVMVAGVILARNKGPKSVV